MHSGINVNDDDDINNDNNNDNNNNNNNNNNNDSNDSSNNTDNNVSFYLGCHTVMWCLVDSTSCVRTKFCLFGLPASFFLLPGYTSFETTTES